MGKKRKKSKSQKKKTSHFKWGIELNRVLYGKWWCIPLIAVLRRQRHVDLCEFEAILVYIVSSRTARATQINPVSKSQTEQN